MEPKQLTVQPFIDAVRVEAAKHDDGAVLPVAVLTEGHHLLQAVGGRRRLSRLRLGGLRDCLKHGGLATQNQPKHAIRTAGSQDRGLQT